MEKNKQQRIEQYLNGELTAEERRMFEKELKNDAELQQQVSFAKDLHVFFDNRNPNLEENLHQLDDVFFAESSNQPSWLKIGLGSLVAVALVAGIWWLLSDVAQQKPAEPLPTKSEQLESSQTLPEVQPEEKAPQQMDEKKMPQKRVAPEEKKQKVQVPIAALNPEDFKVNPILEGLITERVRNDEVATTLSELTLDTILKKGNPTVLKIKGTTNAVPPLKLTIYSNKSDDFDNDTKYLTTTLTTTPIEEEYEFLFNAKIDFQSGLYYFLIESVETEDLLVVSKFQVK